MFECESCAEKQEQGQLGKCDECWEIKHHYYDEDDRKRGDD